MGYISTLTPSQKTNMGIVLSEAKKQGVTNQYAQAAILSIISKESNFVPQEEKGYENTSTARIKEVFKSTLGGMSDSEIDALKANPRKFFNAIYGKRYGNDDGTGPFDDDGDGNRYRGRGFNQLTFKANYDAIGKLIGKDLRQKPDLLAQPEIAAAACVAYFRRKFNSFSSAHQQAYHAANINDFKTITDATLAIFHANAGWGKPVYTTSTKTSTGGLEKSLSRCDEFLTYVKSH